MAHLQLWPTLYALLLVLAIAPLTRLCMAASSTRGGGSQSDWSSCWLVGRWTGWWLSSQRTMYCCCDPATSAQSAGNTISGLRTSANTYRQTR